MTELMVDRTNGAEYFFCTRYTIGLEDLLLNAVALEFVLSIDELIYKVLSPARMKHLIDCACPLTVKASLYDRTWSGVDTAALVNVALTLAWLLGMYLAVLKPQINTLLLARDALCGGDLDFVFTVDGMGVPAWTYPDEDRNSTRLFPKRNFPIGTNRPELTTAYSSLPFKPVKATYSAKMVDVLLQSFGRYKAGVECDVSWCLKGNGSWAPNPDPPPCCYAQKTFVPGIDAGRFSLKTKAAEDVISANELWNPTCVDTLVGNNSAGYVDLIEGAMGDAVRYAECDGGCPLNATLCRPQDGKCVRATCTAVKPYCHEVR